MTKMSLVPQQIEAAGIDLAAFIELLIEDAIVRFARI